MSEHALHTKSRTGSNDAPKPKEQSNNSSGTKTDNELRQRAEELVDRIGENVGYYTALLGHQILRLAARAQEQAEDMWAEAQSIRRREKG